jgi:hypothetical protein
VTPVSSAPGRGLATGSAVSGLPLRVLRSEGLVLVAASLAAFFTALDEAWWLVPTLLFLPDLAMAGYARSPRAGALAYNAAHSYPAPALLGALALLADAPLGQAVALIWFAHIGLDRALGYGLKYPSDFTDTHLGRIGVRTGPGSRPGHRDGAGAVPAPRTPDAAAPARSGRSS